MIDHPSFGDRAFEHLSKLVRDIGPRPAGSHAESIARDYVEEQMKSFGYRVERLAAPFAPRPGFSPFYALAGLILGVGSWVIRTMPWGGIWLPLVVMASPELSRWQTRRLALTAETQNIIAYSDAVPGARTLILSAHVDSARARVGTGFIRLWLQSRTMDLAMRIAIMGAVLSLLSILGFTIPGLLEIGFGLTGSMVGLWMILNELVNQSGSNDKYSPGANDNASGVGVLLTLAEHYALSPIKSFQLGFLFTGAEETGLHGAEGFAASFSESDQPMGVICLDMVGAGKELRFCNKDGIIIPTNADSNLNALIRTAYPDAKPLWYTIESGDHLPFLKRGIPATSIQVTGSTLANTTYHTISDTLEIIEIQALEMTVQAIMELVRIVEGTGGID